VFATGRFNPSHVIVPEPINRGADLLSEVHDLHGHHSPRNALLRVNNASARETSLLSPERFDRMIGSASVATFIEPGKAFLPAFEQTDDYDGTHFKWFQSRYDRFLYVDRLSGYRNKARASRDRVRRLAGLDCAPLARGSRKRRIDGSSCPASVRWRARNAENFSTPKSVILTIRGCKT
jgi:hypothetical protein